MKSALDVSDILLNSMITHADGSFSRPAVEEFGVFILMCWGFVMFFNKATLEWLPSIIQYVGIFATVFVARAAHSAYLNSKNGNGDKK